MLEHVQNLPAALGPLILANLLPVSEDEGIRKLVRSNGGLVVIDILFLCESFGRKKQSDGRERYQELEKPHDVVVVYGR